MNAHFLRILPSLLLAGLTVLATGCVSHPSASRGKAPLPQASQRVRIYAPATDHVSLDFTPMTKSEVFDGLTGSLLKGDMFDNV